jgi:predicted tellurium resistance membrane protein TerC
MEDPYYAEVASFVGSFITAVFLVMAWIVICKTLPPLRQRLGVTYGIAIALAVLSPIIFIIRGYAVHLWDFMGALFCAGLVFWKYRHALANTDKARSISNE